MKFYAKITRKLRENYAKITCKILKINKMIDFTFPQDSVKFP